jgi:hypothetical protein
MSPSGAWMLSLARSAISFTGIHLGIAAWRDRAIAALGGGADRAAFLDRLLSRDHLAHSCVQISDFFGTVAYVVPCPSQILLKSQKAKLHGASRFRGQTTRSGHHLSASDACK